MKRVLITGGTKGIGLATVQKFIHNSFEVIVIARDFSSFHLDAKQVAFDLTQYQKIPQLIKNIGNIDILINNAGLMNALPFDQYPNDKMEDILAINIKTPVTLIKEVAPYMISQKKGRIVNVASIAGEIGHPDIWYGITKAGVINMTKSFAKQLGSYGIVINAVAPGPVETDMLNTIPEDRKNSIKKTVYTNRFAQPQEIAETIFWLATEAPEYINGVTIDINNGAFPR